MARRRCPSAPPFLVALERTRCFLAEFLMHRHGFLPKDPEKEKQLLLSHLSGVDT